ncbi:triokinase/FMN cyclase [Halyomorpha halys]|uniref:triokinase/FMN cyclase n=1 Tax=Halyomorpha halys TaxID=286706 RepID=UPI0006D515EE|nr:triokinase/FMN cyclase-like [Halyomorpha halys]
MDIAKFEQRPRSSNYWNEVTKKFIIPEFTRSSTPAESYRYTITPQAEKRTKVQFHDDVHSSLEGAALTNSDIMLLEHYRIVLRKDHRSLNNQVKLVSGGKTGHEPLFTSYVGPGMLTAAVVGTRTTAPTPSEIYICLKELSCNHNGGILAIVPNSSEEVFNFGLGIERARCKGVLVDMITIGDDCWESTKSRFGRTCLTGIVLAYKIAAGMVEEKQNLKEIFLRLKTLCMGSISCHISRMTYIGTNFNHDAGQLLPEYNIRKIITTMIDYLVDSKKYFALPINSQSSFILMVNSYTCDRLFVYSCLEEVIEQLSSRKIKIVRALAGTFVSGDRGLSITLLDSENDVNMLRYIEYTCCCQFWPRIDQRKAPLIVKGPRLPDQEFPLIPMGPFVEKKEFIDIPLKFVSKALVNSEKILNNLDLTYINFGTSILPAIEIINKECNNTKFPKYHPYNLLNMIGLVCQDNIANIQGSILYTFFLGAAQAFLNYSREVNVTANMWVDSLSCGVDSIKAYTQLNENDLSILSALSPFSRSLTFFTENQTEDLDHMLDDAITITNKVLMDTFSMDVPCKLYEMPEVTGQTAFICLTAIVEAYRLITSQVPGKQPTPIIPDISSDDNNSEVDPEVILL